MRIRNEMRTRLPGKDRKMEHTPYGYDIVNGKPLINKKQADDVREIFAGYLRGLSMKEAGKAVGLNVTHCVIKQMLFNRRYLGNGIYPRIIDDDTFNAAAAEQRRRAEYLGRNNRPKKTRMEPVIYTEFSVKHGLKKYFDPIKQAEYAYGRIQGR